MMPVYNWRIGSRRSSNDVAAHAQRLDATDGSGRYALGRNVKGDRVRTGGSVTYSVIEVWTLRRRIGKTIETVETGCTRSEAERWVSGS